MFFRPLRGLLPWSEKHFHELLRAEGLSGRPDGGGLRYTAWHS